MNPDLRHPHGHMFPAGPKAPAPVNARHCEHWQYARDVRHSATRECHCRAFFTFSLPRAIAAALQQRNLERK